MVAGREVTPKDFVNTERLKQYWRTCVAGVTKAAGVPPGTAWVKGFCAERHHEVTGEWPGPNAHGGHGHGSAHGVRALVRRSGR